MRSEHIDNYNPDYRFTHAVYLWSLERAGVKFDIDDLSEFEWMLLADLKSALEARQVEQIRNK